MVSLGGMVGDLPTIETERLILRKLRSDDMRDVFAYASDPEVARFTSWEPHESIEHTRDFFKRVLERYAHGKPGPWGIEHKGDVKIIGTCGFQSWQTMHARAEIAYAIARPYWSKGYATESARALISYGFGSMGLNRIESTCRPENVASWRVMEKVGMRREGVLRQRVFLKGRYLDTALYSILLSEWAESVALTDQHGVHPRTPRWRRE